MVDNQIENRIILELCITCPNHNHNQTYNPQMCLLGEHLCNPLVNADNALAFFKKTIVDCKTRAMHKEIKNQFAERRAEDERWLKENGFCSD